MVESGHGNEALRRSDIVPVDFRSGQHPDLRVEVADFVEVERRRLPAVPDGVPERPMFEHFIIVRGGHGLHTVDFEDIDLHAGRMVRVRPGQLKQWTASPDLDAVFVLARNAHDAEHWFAGAPSTCDLDDELHATVLAIVESLQRTQSTFVTTGTGTALQQALWNSLVAAFDTAIAHTQPTPPAPYAAFMAAIEADPSRSRNVQDHVADLGWSERTVRRACLEVTGLTPKQLLDQRVLLEAKRILAHTERPAASIAAELGFTEPTNFQKFFGRLTGQTPAAFRRDVTG